MTILVIAEQRDGKIKKASYEAVKAASAVASQLDATVTAVLFGGDEAAAKSLGGYGAAKTVQDRKSVV